VPDGRAVGRFCQLAIRLRKLRKLRESAGGRLAETLDGGQR